MYNYVKQTPNAPSVRLETTLSPFWPSVLAILVIALSLPTLVVSSIMISRIPTKVDTESLESTIQGSISSNFDGMNTIVKSDVKMTENLIRTFEKLAASSDLDGTPVEKMFICQNDTMIGGLPQILRENIYFMTYHDEKHEIVAQYCPISCETYLQTHINVTLDLPFKVKLPDFFDQAVSLKFKNDDELRPFYSTSISYNPAREINIYLFHKLYDTNLTNVKQGLTSFQVLSQLHISIPLSQPANPVLKFGFHDKVSGFELRSKALDISQTPVEDGSLYMTTTLPDNVTPKFCNYGIENEGLRVYSYF